LWTTLFFSMYCLCVNVYCHRVTTQFQLTNKKTPIRTSAPFLPCYQFSNDAFCWLTLNNYLALCSVGW